MFIYLCGLKQRDENKVKQVFDATLKTVVKTGIAGITMRQVAKEAHLATGTLYIYFKDKEELLNQLYVDCRTSSINAYFKGYNDALPYKEGFEIVWRNTLEHRMANFDEAVFMEQCYHSQFISASTKDMNQKLFQPLYKLFERGKEEGVLKDLDTMMLMMFMMTSITGVIKYVNYHNKRVSDDMIKNAFRICWDGVRA